MTRRAMDFMAEAGDAPWCLHLSYIKPHWPYIAPAPYNTMYGPEHVLPAVRREAERRDPHPVFREFMDLRVGRDVRARRGARRGRSRSTWASSSRSTISSGSCFAFMRGAGPARQHADRVHVRPRRLSGRPLAGREGPVPRAVGVKIPLIVCDPSPEADATRGTVCDELVEAIDLAPTFLDALGADPAAAIAPAGRPLAAAVPARQAASRHGAAASSASTTIPCCPWRRSSASSRATRACSWSRTSAGNTCTPSASGRCCSTWRRDPQELARSRRRSGLRGERAAAGGSAGRMGAAPLAAHHPLRAAIKAGRGKSQRKGILIGVWDESELPAELWSRLSGRRCVAGVPACAFGALLPDVRSLHGEVRPERIEVRVHALARALALLLTLVLAPSILRGSQGGVKVPTGGMQRSAAEPASAFQWKGRADQVRGLSRRSKSGWKRTSEQIAGAAIGTHVIAFVSHRPHARFRAGAWVFGRRNHRPPWDRARCSNDPPPGHGCTSRVRRPGTERPSARLLRRLSPHFGWWQSLLQRAYLGATSQTEELPPTRAACIRRPVANSLARQMNKSGRPWAGQQNRGRRMLRGSIRALTPPSRPP